MTARSSGRAATRSSAAARSATTTTPASMARDGTAQPRRRLDEIERPQRTGGQVARLPLRRVGFRPVAEHDRGAAAVGLPSAPRRRSAPRRSSRRPARRPPSRARPRPPPRSPARTRSSLATEPNSPAPPWFFCSHAAPSLRSRPDRQRVDARAQRRHLTFGAALGGLQFGDPLVGEPQRGDRAVVVIVEADLTGVELADAALHGLELGLRLLRRASRPPRCRPSGAPRSRRSTRRGCAWCRPGRTSRARPSRRSASARAAARCARSASAAMRSRSASSARAASCRSRALRQLGEQLAARARRPRRPRPRARRGRRPGDASTSASSSCARSLAMRTVALTRSASADSRNHVCCAASARPLRPGHRRLVGRQLDGRRLQPGR